MGYVGVPPQSGFITTAKQRVTSSTNNYVDLDNSISSLADVIVWVNSVKQDSTNLTLTTSTRITLGGTLTASDVVEIAYLGKAVATQNPSTNSVTNDMLAGSIANSKLATDPLNASNLASGTVPTARLGSGTASSSTFLRGDSTYAEAGGGSLVHLATIDNSNLSADVVQFQQVFSTNYKRYKVMGKFQGTGNGANLEFSWLKSDNSNHNVSNYHTVALGYKINSVDYNQEGWLDWGQMYSRLLLDQATGSHVHSFSMDLFPNGYDNVNYPQMYAQCNSWLYNNGGNKMFVGQVGSYLENTTSLSGGGVRFGSTSGLFGTVNFGIWGYKDS